ncbi:flavodoxin domain-containing protein [Kitasatospora sp. NPDC097643]|uniref:flavodoxin domain-containing protein n=1 Tax=Kitasatospora sp. NPDC097643 TaxID=3157230 RepID=UPI0033291AE4
MRLFVGCASAHGSTTGIAERIAADLRGHGYEVVVSALSHAPDPSAFDAAVLGSAIHDGRWLPEAEEFVRRNADALAQRPVWLFSVSLVGERSSAFHPRMARRLRRMRARHLPEQAAPIRRAVRPLGEHDFAGAVEPGHWPVTGRLVFRLMGGRFGDHRDWAEVDDWGREIAQALAAG